MNKSQAEKKVYAFPAVFRVDVNGVNLSRFRILQKRRHLIISLIRNLWQDVLNNKPMVDSNFAFIDPVSAVYYGGQAGYAHTRMIT